jgi:hypothetical protein
MTQIAVRKNSAHVAEFFVLMLYAHCYTKEVKKQIAIVTAIFALTLFALHGVGTLWNWYGTKPFFDKYLHFLGGMFVFFALVMWLFRRAALQFTGRQVLVLVGFVLFIGIGWEVFEYTVQHFTGVVLATMSDSIADVVFDNFGALVAATMLFFAQDFVSQPKKRYNTYRSWK